MLKHKVKIRPVILRGLLQQRDAGVHDLGEIVRRNIRRHTDSDA